MSILRSESSQFLRAPQALFILLPLVAGIILLFVQACGTMNNSNSITTSSAQTSSFAFVTNSGSGTVSGFAVTSSGTLSQISGSPFPAGAGAEFMAFDKVHKLLFIANQNANNLSAFTVNTSTGMLSPVTGSPFATGTTPLGVAVDAMGRFVFVANQADNNVSAFNIDPMSGALTAAPGSPFGGVISPFGVAINPAATFLFVSNFNGGSGTGNTISTLAINSSTGALSPVDIGMATSNPAGITAPIGLAADANFLFVGNHMAESVVSFNVNSSSGALSAASSLPAPASGCGVSCHHNPLRLAIDPRDRFIYWTNVQAGTVSTFNINNGALAFVSEISAGQHPFGLALDPTGSFLFAVNKVDNTISAYSVDANTGMLTALPGSPLAEGGQAPTDIVTVAKQ